MSGPFGRLGGAGSALAADDEAEGAGWAWGLDDSATAGGGGEVFWLSQLGATEHEAKTAMRLQKRRTALT